jgi:endonuclease/exonuclease/phosphatase family metal-dependent hydrolase
MPTAIVLAGTLAGAAVSVSTRVPQSGQSLKGLTWNVEQPQGTRLQGVIDFLVRQNADLIALQEIYEGESAQIRNLLRSRTSRSWDGRFHRGVMILTHLPILDHHELWIPVPDRYGPGRPAVGITVRLNGGRVRVFNAHLACCEDIEARQRQVNALIEWMGRYEGPALVAGDFNAVPSALEISGATTPYGKGMAAEYLDLWTGPGGETHRNPQPSRRIDYWFRSKAGMALAPAAQTLQVLDVCTGWAFPAAEAGEGGPSCLADHRPVEATFRIGPSSPAEPGGGR